MIDTNELAELLFPQVMRVPAEVEAEYPPRQLPEGAKVTRFAPSPTGFVHFGGLFPAAVGERLAHQSGGVFYLRIEDTDAKREVPGAKEGLIRTLAHYGIRFDEGAAAEGDFGAYGPYTQSKRCDIYHVYAKQLVREGKAYPVFTTREALAELNAVDKKAEIKARDWHEDSGEMAEEMRKNREFTMEDVRMHLEAGDPFVLRMMADGDPERKFRITDLIKGELLLPENDRDEVLLKSDGVPSYHFAHVIDDHLMGTTHVIRGEEWLPSLPRHIMLFRFLGFRAPKYMHIAQLMHLDENGCKKKLSKRDMGANLDDYEKMGYAPETVMEYVMTLLNSNYEEWHAANPSLSYTDFPFSIKKMSTSGCLFDFNKLKDVSKNVLSRMTADQVYSSALCWAEKFDPALAEKLTADVEYAKRILSIGRGGKKPRKDLTAWTDIRPYMALFYDDWFAVSDDIDEKFDRTDVKAALDAFAGGYDAGDDMNEWFEKIKAICPLIGFCPDTKEYKQNPAAYKGSVGDVSMFLRVAVTGKLSSPDLYTVMQILGEKRTLARARAFAAAL